MIGVWANCSNISRTASNSLDGLGSIIARAIAGAVSLIGFGLDSLIEVTSGAALLWRLHHDLDHSRREQVERVTLRIVGGCFVGLALDILYESRSTLIGHKSPISDRKGLALPFYYFLFLVADTVTKSSPNLQEPSAKAIATPQR